MLVNEDPITDRNRARVPRLKRMVVSRPSLRGMGNSVATLRLSPKPTTQLACLQSPNMLNGIS